MKRRGRSKYQLRNHILSLKTGPALCLFTTMLIPLIPLLLHVASTVAATTTKCLVSGNEDSINNALALGASLRLVMSIYNLLANESRFVIFHRR